jgi:excisionase family DNA binding protein
MILLQVSQEELAELINSSIKTHLSEALAPLSQPQTELLSKKEVCNLLGITLNTLDSHIKKRTIPAYGLGSRLMFKRDEVLASLTKIN